MSKKFYQIAIAVVVFVALGVFIMEGLALLKPEKKKEKPKEVPRYVETSTIQYRDYSTAIEAAGRVSSVEQVNLSSEVQGKVQRGDVPLKKGASFKKGQVLVRIINPEVNYNLKSQKSRFLMNIANVLADLKIDYPNAYKDWNHFFQSVSVDTKLPELPEITDNQLKIFLSARNVLGDYYSIKSFEKRFEKHTIIAPFSGSYTNVNMQEGSVINPGSVIGSIINTSYYEIEVPVDKNDVLWIKRGQFVQVIPEGETSDTLRGKIVRIADFIDPTTQTIPIFVRISPQPGLVYEGEYFSCRIDNIKVKNAMELMRSAVFNHNEVFIVHKGRLQKREINIKKLNEKTLYFNGLNEGLKLVSEPLINANENMKVEIIKK